MSPPFRLNDDGIDLYVRLTPKSAADLVEGIETLSSGRSHVKVRVRAVPEKGAANTALARLIAKTFGAPASAVTIVAGQTARLKTVRIAGDPAQLASRLAEFRQM
ncbi:hypothetical protein ASD64_19120 [Mesorhizobium sp. Root157]|uniref:DUF167 family protein n=1 Tax=Mesorhizobium sp. Root157 TaxID=1736477 RepID=UPI0006FB1604|nr:DUF167 family protein [Mesorhizobium sp. Root157]KQZ93243.1 hypothetical protein ASD64_19120 [Mesorhizobium sp. Root157]